MTNQDESPEPSQRVFAMTLVDELGLDEAMQICRDNSWYSIWDILCDE
ncbi:MAG: hypothetical protein VCD50_00600 [Alphaproteobacteria bacterium]